MDSNNLYQEQQPGTEPDMNGQGAYQNNDMYQTGGYQSNDAYQQGNAYQNNGTYQNDGAYQQQSGYPQYGQNGSYQNNTYNGTYNNGNYNGGNYGGSYGSYGSGGYQNPYQSSQLDLEEPVKMSEWLISMLLMLVPCVNIVMMFVWAFSKTEKKSKSNFFKAYLIQPQAD